MPPAATHAATARAAALAAAALAAAPAATHTTATSPPPYHRRVRNRARRPQLHRRLRRRPRHPAASALALAAALAARTAHAATAAVPAARGACSDGRASSRSRPRSSPSCSRSVKSAATTRCPPRCASARTRGCRSRCAPTPSCARPGQQQRVAASRGAGADTAERAAGCRGYAHRRHRQVRHDLRRGGRHHRALRPPGERDLHLRHERGHRPADGPAGAQGNQTVTFDTPAARPPNATLEFPLPTGFQLATEYPRRLLLASAASDAAGTATAAAAADVAARAASPALLTDSLSTGELLLLETLPSNPNPNPNPNPSPNPNQSCCSRRCPRTLAEPPGLHGRARDARVAPAAGPSTTSPDYLQHTLLIETSGRRPPSWSGLGLG